MFQQLYKEGARFFWVHNTGPHGCLPYSVIYDQSKPVNLDQSGCVKPLNEVAQEFNRQLKDSVSRLRSELPLAVFTYVDVYSAKYALISNAKSQGNFSYHYQTCDGDSRIIYVLIFLRMVMTGFVDPFDFCCGSYYGYHVDCGKKAIVNGTVYGNPCKNPSRHISWDGIHYSQAANLLIAERILNGSFSNPPVSVTEACRLSKNV